LFQRKKKRFRGGERGGGQCALVKGEMRPRGEQRKGSSEKVLPVRDKGDN